MNEADFELLETDISKEILPDNIHAIHAAEIDKYSFVKEDNLNIARLHSVSTYFAGKEISFAAKYTLLVELCNNAASQLQFAWRAKISNPFVASIVPPAYNKVLQMDTDLKQLIYEKWE